MRAARAEQAGEIVPLFERGIQYAHYSPEAPARAADETVTDVSELAATGRRGTERKTP